jgi:hypothetical protein
VGEYRQHARYELAVTRLEWLQLAVTSAAGSVRKAARRLRSDEAAEAREALV